MNDSTPSVVSHATQRDILSHLARIPGFFSLVSSGRIRQSDFTSNNHRFVLVAIAGVLDRFPGRTGEPIPKHILLKELVDMVRSGEIYTEEVPSLSEEVERVYAQPLSPAFFDERYILGEIRKQRTSALTLDRDLVSDPEGFQRRLVEVMGETEACRSDDQTGPLDLIHEDDEIRMLPVAGIEKIPTGIPSLDVRLYGGLPPRKTGMICAYTGVGKSAMTVTMAGGAAAAAFPTLIFSTELGKEEFYRRWLSNRLRISYALIEHGGNDATGNPIDREALNRAIVAERRRQMEQSISIRTAFSMLEIVRMPSATIDQYRNKVAEVSRRFMDRVGQPLRAVFVDWIDKMSPTLVRGKDPALRHFLAAIVQEIDDFGKDNDLATWVTTQANDTAAGKSKVGMTAINEGRAKAHPVSVFCGLGASDEDRENNIWHLTVDKFRDGQTFAMRVRGDLDHQTFTDLTAEQLRLPPPGVAERNRRRGQ